RSTGYLAAAAGLGFVGMSIRQYAAIPVAAVLAVFIWDAWRNEDRKRVGVGVRTAAVVGIAFVALLVWWSHVPHGKALGPRVPNVESIRLTVADGANLLRLAGMMLLPIVVFANPRALVRRALACNRRLTIQVTAIVGTYLLLGYALEPARPFVGNYF